MAELSERRKVSGSHWIQFVYVVGYPMWRISIRVGSVVPLTCPLCWRRMHGGAETTWDGSEATNSAKFGSQLDSRPPLLVYFRCVGILFAMTHLSA